MSSKRRRQAGAFISYNGRSTSSCAEAGVLSLTNNQLLMTFANGTVAQFSGNTGDAYDYFAPSTTPGNITTTFSLSNTGTLLWTNSAFYNGNALFCVLPSGALVAVFQKGAQPKSCDFIDLTIAEREWPTPHPKQPSGLPVNKKLVTSCADTSSGTAALGGSEPSG